MFTDARYIAKLCTSLNEAEQEVDHKPRTLLAGGGTDQPGGRTGSGSAKQPTAVRRARRSKAKGVRWTKIDEH